jgi:hypothetical protein
MLSPPEKDYISNPRPHDKIYNRYTSYFVKINEKHNLS